VPSAKSSQIRRNQPIEITNLISDLALNAPAEHIPVRRLSSSPTLKSSDTLLSLQALRAIAAWMVVVDHALLELTGNAAHNWITRVAWALGSSGVSVFFTISGFIMVHISWTNFGTSKAAANFMQRRIIRIVPLYWAATILALAFHRVSATHGATDGWQELGYSLAFVPYPGGDQSWSPILPQGWTLNFEIFFYLLFAVGLFFPRRVALAAVTGLLVAFVLFGSYSPNASLAYLSSPIVLWFALGMVLAIIWRRFELSEPDWIARRAKFLEPFGDASYSTYLSHGLVLTVMLWVWKMAVGQPSIVLVFFSLTVATIFGQIIYVVIEKRLLRIINSNVRKTIRVFAACPES
jgi:exopolysaccharide production protein ExoZ